MNYGHYENQPTHGKQPMSAKSGKRVKAAVRSTLRPIEARQNALDAKLSDMEKALAEINAMHEAHAKVEGDAPPMPEGERRYAEWREKQHAARLAATDTLAAMQPEEFDRPDDKDATVLVHFSADSTWDENEPLEPVDPARYPAPPGKVSVLPNGVRAVQHPPRGGHPDDKLWVICDAAWDDDTPLEPVDPSRYPCWPSPPCNPTPATSPTPIPVPVRRFTVFKAVAKSVAVLGLLGFAAVGVCTTGGLVAYRLGYVEIDQLAHGVSWLNEQSDWILSGAGLTGLMASARAAWPFIRARAWSALCDAVQQASQGQS